MSRVVVFDAALAGEYRQRFATASIRPERAGEVARLAKRLAEPGRTKRYREVAGRVGAPWQVVGILHALEANLDFGRHLHNGDPLSARTVHVPKGRPLIGTPPFAWEDSAVDALTLAGLDVWDDWSVAGVAYVLERYNGFGCRRRTPPVPSPYLWSFTTAYTSGKYVADHVWSDTAVSKQCGGMALLRALAEAGLIALPEASGGGTTPPAASGVLYVAATAAQAPTAQPSS